MTPLVTPRPPVTPRKETGLSATASRRGHLTVDEVCAELGVARRTFYEWRAKGVAPRCIKLPNGALRVRRSDLDDWLEARYEEAA